MLLTMYEVFRLATFTNSHKHKFVVSEARFHAESIGASPVIIAHKTAKLFKFLQVHSQHERPIVVLVRLHCPHAQLVPVARVLAER